MDHTTLSSMELRARQAPSSMYTLGIESSFVPQDIGHAEFSSELVKELVGATKKLDDTLEEQYRDIFSVAVTRVFRHLLLRDPYFKFEEFMGPVPEESSSDLAFAVEGHMNTLLGMFLYGNYEEPDKEPPALIMK
ncbi:hypothetical protein D1007_57576 [Hordeum vulgare]|nr:hypothetical protein D1007_57576 [Hordeum vulgare]